MHFRFCYLFNLSILTIFLSSPCYIVSVMTLKHVYLILKIFHFKTDENKHLNPPVTKRGRRRRRILVSAIFITVCLYTGVNLRFLDSRISLSGEIHGFSNSKDSHIGHNQPTIDPASGIDKHRVQQIYRYKDRQICRWMDRWMDRQIEAGVRLVVSFKSGNKGLQKCLVLTNIRIK